MVEMLGLRRIGTLRDIVGLSSRSEYQVILLLAGDVQSEFEFSQNCENSSPPPTSSLQKAMWMRLIHVGGLTN